MPYVKEINNEYEMLQLKHSLEIIANISYNIKLVISNKVNSV